MPVWPALAGAALPTKAAAFLLALHRSRSDTSTQSSKLAAALRCEVDANRMSVRPACTGAACQQRLAPSSLLCTGAVKDRPPIEQACGCTSVRGGCKLCAWLSCTRKRCLLTMAGTFLLALHWSCQRSPTNRARLRLLISARRLQTVRLCGQHSQELLADKGCRLPLCFALEPSGLSDQSSKLVAARRCVADALCLPVWLALAGAACQQRLPPSSLLCGETDKDLSN